jgi:hypothetical protein
MLHPIPPEAFLNGDTALGQVYRFLLSAFRYDESAAQAEFRRFVAGELSEPALELARRWVREDQTISVGSTGTNARARAVTVKGKRRHSFGRRAAISRLPPNRARNASATARSAKQYRR